LEGAKGDPGSSATIEVGETETTAPGEDADVENVGTENAAVFNFKIPRGSEGPKGSDGADGLAGTQNVGDVETTTLNPGSDAAVTVTNSGTQNAAIFDYSFSIPKGEKGETGTGVSIIGSIDSVGPPDPADYPDIENGDIVVDSNGDGWLWDGSDFTNVGPIRGPEGPPGDAATVSATATANQVACDQPATASVTNNGTSSAASFAFSFNLPSGCDGSPGAPGAPGEDGKDGLNSEVFVQPNQPTAQREGALWIKTAP
jgi:hypothetical protein